MADVIAVAQAGLKLQPELLLQVALVKSQPGALMPCLLGVRLYKIPSPNDSRQLLTFMTSQVHCRPNRLTSIQRSMVACADADAFAAGHVQRLEKSLMSAKKVYTPCKPSGVP